MKQEEKKSNNNSEKAIMIEFLSRERASENSEEQKRDLLRDEDTQAGQQVCH